MLYTFCLLAIFSLCEASTKKGVAINGGHSYHCGDEDALTNIHWWYDWHESPWQHSTKHCSSSVKSGYVPMVWAWRHNIDEPVHLQHNTHYVLGFNEPNFRQQANMSPQDAATHWKSLESIAHGRKLVSPAVAPGGYLDPVVWLEQFFSHCHGCQVDYIATHAYWCNADITMNFLKKLWDRFHKPIWLTEFACPQKNSVNDQLNYMKAILPRLESASYVYRYSWFVSRTHGDGWVFPAASLLDENGPHLSTLGHYYNNF
ncbi:unnamed protein product [Mytilus edulis]|nr:unnamed protein product [Mytilus edulis]